MNSGAPHSVAGRAFLLASGLLLLGLGGSAPASAQQQFFARPGELPPIDARTQAAVLDSITTAIDTVYVIKETADRIIAHLKDRFEAGAYKELTDPAAFVQKLDEDARTVYDDNHFGLRAMKPLDPTAEERVEDPRETDRYRQSLRARNYGFEKVEILPGNVGYLELTQFVHTDLAAETAVAAMNFLANTDALIIDLRRNPGGSAAMIRLVASYLFSEQKHLINWYQRDTDQTVQSYTLDYVPGKRLAETPLFVLTSEFTGSAAEEFSFDMKHLERGTLVGDTTSGGGHTVATLFCHFEGFRVGIRLPFGRAFDPKTNEGWEGVGVIPHLAVPSEQALDVAHREALKKMLDEAQDEDARFALTWAVQGLEGRIAPTRLSVDQLAEYEGDYGPRRIFLEEGQLLYQREGRPKMLLEPMGQDLFRVGDLEYFRLRFERNDAGTIQRLVGLYDDGREDANERS